MSQIEELQGRITAALDRISQGLDLQANTTADPEEMAALQQALDDERTASQQLEERNKTLNDRISELEAEVEALTAQVASAGSVELPDMLEKYGSAIAEAREASEKLRANNEKLREAHTAGSSEPHLINSGMMAELDSLKSMRDLDKAELMAILETLEGVLGASDAA